MKDAMPSSAENKPHQKGIEQAFLGRNTRHKRKAPGAYTKVGKGKPCEPTSPLLPAGRKPQGGEDERKGALWAATLSCACRRCLSASNCSSWSVPACLFLAPARLCIRVRHLGREHGRQFKAVFVRISPPNALTGIERYLWSGMVKGIGPDEKDHHWIGRRKAHPGNYGLSAWERHVDLPCRAHLQDLRPGCDRCGHGKPLPPGARHPRDRVPVCGHDRPVGLASNAPPRFVHGLAFPTRCRRPLRKATAACHAASSFRLP
jgi:hypothetical protein